MPDSREKEIFEQALELPSGAERIAFARQACEDDATPRILALVTVARESVALADHTIGRHLLASEWSSASPAQATLNASAWIRFIESIKQAFLTSSILWWS
ncbi:MAG TPA: hypothetical protein PK640_11895 [Verrucomicrobiota bacterium]|nr:hypothetical protein [Verrucomicrobiota bacterium]